MQFIPKTLEFKPMTTMSRDVETTYLLINHAGTKKLVTVYASRKRSKVPISDASFQSFADVGMQVVDLSASMQKSLDSADANH